MTDLPKDQTSPADQQSAQGALRIRLSDIMKGQREAVIEHEGQDYRLRITASGKLILTK